jgi:hypothetical protein
MIHILLGNIKRLSSVFQILLFELSSQEDFFCATIILIINLLLFNF